MSDQALTIECTVHFDRRGHGGRQEVREGPSPTSPPPGRVPRVAKLMALAHRFDELIQTNQVKDASTLARLGHVTSARVCQIMSLLCLVPEIQEAILFLPAVTHGRDPIVLRDVLPIALVRNWNKQRQMWAQITGKIKEVQVNRH